MRERLFLSLLPVALGILGLGLAWWTDEEVVGRRRAWLDTRVRPWLDAHVPAWVWELPVMAALVVGVPVTVAWAAWAWVQWVRFG